MCPIARKAHHSSCQTVAHVCEWLFLVAEDQSAFYLFLNVIKRITKKKYCPLVDKNYTSVFSRSLNVYVLCFVCIFSGESLKQNSNKKEHQGLLIVFFISVNFDVFIQVPEFQGILFKRLLDKTKTSIIPALFFFFMMHIVQISF